MTNASGIGKVDVNNIGTTLQPEGKPARSKVLGQKEFMELLITQMKNQDPLQPQDPAQFVTQLSQLGVVDGVGKLNQSFTNLTNSLYSNQALQASALVGRKVLVPRSDSYVSPGERVEGVVKLDNSVSDLRLRVINQSGEVVKNLDLGMASIGDKKFSWDGTDMNGVAVPNGRYLVQAVGSTQEGEHPQEVRLYANVNSVTVGKNNDELKLNLSGMGSIGFSDISEIN